MYRLIFTRRFQRSLPKFQRAHPELRRRIVQVLASLKANPFDPRLRLHQLHGDMEGTYAIRITYGYRITLILRITEHEIDLLDIGSHDDVYR